MWFPRLQVDPSFYARTWHLETVAPMSSLSLCQGATWTPDICPWRLIPYVRYARRSNMAIWKSRRRRQEQARSTPENMLSLSSLEAGISSTSEAIILSSHEVTDGLLPLRSLCCLASIAVSWFAPWRKDWAWLQQPLLCYSKLKSSSKWNRWAKFEGNHSNGITSSTSNLNIRLKDRKLNEIVVRTTSSRSSLKNLKSWGNCWASCFPQKCCPISKKIFFDKNRQVKMKVIVKWTSHSYEPTYMWGGGG